MRLDLFAARCFASLSMTGPSNPFDDSLAAALAPWEIPFSTEQLDLLRKHFEAVLEANRVMNLTRIVDPVEAAIKHYADSLALLCWARDSNVNARTVLDLGTGAGFPAVPLAVMRPDWSVTAVDSTGKKVDVLTRTASALSLRNLYCVHAHCAHWKTEQTFDLVVMKAFGPLQRCLQSGTPFLPPTGRLVVYKTQAQLPTERTEAAPTARKLHLRAGEPYVYELPLNDRKMDRALAVYRREPRNKPRSSRPR
jgi:16S rRNA (guanine527-N7)-methyltransferase